ncbi:bifunctional helix-turn-helix transcriptional regulator/GNAT family N-acetyltransferase [Ovoidimarina sediminis]|uniref:bifunctional helix-turn-helix transcriptional regulator/GNAT family N-acetyltransferase n=1 Tax=Ovoidimarina sediminis TaxID=3079856 RepID=UPI00292E4E8E|nr:helix-turn-helix domain-containing GNAT family N-acetyltransferase [Rhodophyticola sp. MJ-SS7]
MMQDPVARFRRFARAVTSEVGALDTSFLGRGRPLGAARVLNAIGQGMEDVQTVREYLDLDSGLMSRLLRGLEDEGLIETVPHPDDGRRRIAKLTEAGQREFEIYEEVSNARARALLDRHPAPEELLAAMDLIASALGRERIALTEEDPRSEPARQCLEAYYGELARRFNTGYDVNLARDPGAIDMMRPRGVFLVAWSDGAPMGCVGVKGHGGREGEIKRLWTAPHARRLGVATRLMTQAEAVAAELGIAVLRLDTNSALPEAERFYREGGWQEIARFNDDPYPDLFFEKRLSLNPR